ncbi:EAL domain-containing protein [Rummeliibacillus stabekisii]|uniref:Diguanylate cyclase n=1 Tax=Rummeliibacillus stabekisii TaxID=241244 RepID=A0A143HDF0_9BACL|nr:EAL domain-containing protein [Rummeliibacillus stabekisii]AMW99449.1 diguanylate cyclase [Rummeliibacillus stabekisii]
MDQHIARNTIHTEHLAKLCQYITPKILDSISEGIMITNLKSQIIDVNPAFEFVTGYKKEEVIGKKPDVLQSGNHKKDFYQKMWASIASEGEWQGEIWNRRKTGDVYPEWLKITKITNDEDTIIGYCGIFSDLSDEKNVESELKKRATTDMLTGVSNRFAFTERMNVLLSTSKTHNYQHAVLFLDLDRFKQVNDTLGHAIGDQLLVEVTRRIKTLLKNKDIFARYGGDEFVLTFTDIHHPREALHLGEKIIQLLESPFYIHTHELFITASIGISVYPHDGDDTETLLNKADIAMYYAKDHGKNQFSFYFDDLKTDAKRTFTLDSELRKAISNKNEFEIYYQPKVNYQKQQIIGMEALVRWHNEILGNVSPGEFIPYAEETGLIIPLSEIILEKVCLDAHELIGNGYKMPIAINISSIHFHQPNFITSIQQILERNNLPANHFELELTERTIMNNEKETTRKLILLKHMGFKLSLDDFGTGYSSLSYLVEFPLDCLKIDQSFIKQICSVSDKQAIVHAIIQMAHRLQMSVIAEGVEQRDQVKLLGEMDCDMIQGYYYSKPVPLDEIMEFLEFWELEIEGK